ncbi:MAG: class I SAM-dependent methyltransferase [Bacteroidales bacterium]|nr:class I SAM-dependent methyltransferase [Bacteroidales bacterium]
MEIKKKIYPDSGVELKEFTAKNYDAIMNLATLGFYKGFIKKAIHHMNIQPGDQILDLGCGTGSNAKLMYRYLNEKGHITGLDISEHMERQFRYNFKYNKRTEFIKQRIDVPFNLQKCYDKVFISFVIHGFPHEIRSIVIQNAHNHLKTGGKFFILDFAEFDMDNMPALHRFIFKKIECKYAFDFIKRNWKELLNKIGFHSFTEHFYVKNYIRLLSAQKNGSQFK